ncbi:hypothetical protein MMC30_009180 [Trapelia coarctata]|nr:hypothetical protein [Trapelia coarctata]
MLHPTFVNIITYFYPLGNTSAVCLTQDLPRELNANILLLGCGDARNILFSSYSDGGSKSRQLDITCCDLEAAVLARNIVLYTLIMDHADGSKDIHIWNIYYHMFLDNDSLELLHNQAKKLHSLSGTIHSWHSGKYGRLLRMCDQGSLLRVRRIWSSYGGSDLSGEDKTSFDERFKSKIQTARDMNALSSGCGMNVTGFRSAAPISFTSLKDLPALFQHFWKHGITDEERSSISKYTFPNPMFAGSLEDAFTLHYGTDPLLGFHLATAYASLSLDSPLKLSGYTRLRKVVAAARLQLREWSTSFRRHAQKNITIRFFAGDALAFCHTLQHKRTRDAQSSSNWYRDQYHLEPLILDGEDYATKGKAPLSFNVIDTSNLLDHVGAINILVAASPLLDIDISATLYTEALVKQEEDLKALVDSMLCGHLPTLSILFGLVPIEYWTNSSAVSTVEEYLLNKILPTMEDKIGSKGQMHSRLTWKRPGSDSIIVPKIGFVATEMAHLMYQVYLKMFQNEDMARNLSNINLLMLHKNSVLHYHRGSLAAFLRFVKNRVTVDWNKSMEVFMGLVEDNTTLLMGMNYIQELYLHLHLLDLYSVDTFKLPFNRVSHPQPLKGLCAWKDIPAVVCITLKVPRAKLNPITDVPLKKLGSPILHCILQSSGKHHGRQWQNIFSSVQLGFGEITSVGSRSDDDFRISVSEDVHGWNGKSSLIVSFLAPTWTVLLEPQAATVAFGVQSTPQSTSTFVGSLGLEMNFYKTTLGNEDNVYITKYRPNHSGHVSVCNFEGSSKITHLSIDEEVTMTLKANVDARTGQITTLTGRFDMLSEDLKSILSSGATVETLQISPCTIGIVIGRNGRQFHLLFPAPILVSRSKCRIARKSSYVEVVAPMADHRYGEGFPYFMYPMFPSKPGPVVWNMPRLNLDCLPIFNLSKTKELDWLTPHTSLMLSSRERHLRERSMGVSAVVHKDARVNLKDSLFSMFMHFTGVQGQQARVFGINNPDDGGIHILVFVSSLRLDLANHTVVLDAAILPLYDSLLPKLGPFLGPLAAKGLCNIKVDNDELNLWKEIIPAWVERCRTWEHQLSCAYLAQSKIPLSVENGENPICTCGQGTLSSKYTFDLPAWHLAAKYAVRAAISPSFSVPFVEQSFEGNDPKGVEVVPEPVKAAHDTGCRVCGKDKAEGGKGLLKCARCQAVRYCSTECQRGDWKEHKKGCKQ